MSSLSGDFTRQETSDETPCVRVLQNNTVHSWIPCCSAELKQHDTTLP